MPDLFFILIRTQCRPHILILYLILSNLSNSAVDQPEFYTSSTMVLLQASFNLPTFLFPRRFQSSDNLAMAPCAFFWFQPYLLHSVYWSTWFARFLRPASFISDPILVTCLLPCHWPIEMRTFYIFVENMDFLVEWQGFGIPNRSEDIACECYFIDSVCDIYTEQLKKRKLLCQLSYVIY